MNNEMREAFEKHIFGKYEVSKGSFIIQRGINDCYVNIFTERDWKIWQAACSWQQERDAELAVI